MGKVNIYPLIMSGVFEIRTSINYLLDRDFEFKVSKERRRKDDITIKGLTVKVLTSTLTLVLFVSVVCCYYFGPKTPCH